jgi:hypothetical protein
VPAWHQIVSSDVLEVPAWHQIVSSDVLEVPAWHQIVSSDVLEVPVWHQIVSSDVLEVPVWHQIVSSDVLEVPAWHHIVSSDVLEVAAWHQIVHLQTTTHTNFKYVSAHRSHQNHIEETKISSKYLPLSPNYLIHTYIQTKRHLLYNYAVSSARMMANDSLC